MRKLYKKNRKIKKKLKIKLYFFSFIILTTLFICFLVIQFDKYVMPLALEVTAKYSNSFVNREINSAINNVINDMKLVSSDFFYDDNKKGLDNQYVNINTILINNVCANISDQLSKNLSNLTEQKFYISLGTILGYNIFSNTGPKVPVSVVSIGQADVSYETNFKSVGINQINFQVLLTISTQVSFVSPFYGKNIDVKRNVVLVDSIFNGKVPNSYLDLSSFDSINKK